MISLLYGENDFALKQHLKQLIDTYSDKNTIERVDGSTISIDDLANFFTGVSLFSTERLVVIDADGMSKDVWDKLAEYIEVENLDTHIVLIDSSPDKRTKTFKLLQKNTATHEFKSLSEKEAQEWLQQQSVSMGIKLSNDLVEKVVARSGVDQWKMYFALQKLAHVDIINLSSIDEHVEASSSANVFALIDASLHKSPDKVYRLIQDISMNEDPFFFFGLLSSQLFQLITLASTKKTPTEVATDLGVHPYPLQKLKTISTGLSKSDIDKIVSTVTKCDNQLKRSGAEPWLVIEQALMKIAKR